MSFDEVHARGSDLLKEQSNAWFFDFIGKEQAEISEAHAWFFDLLEKEQEQLKKSALA